MVRTLLIENSRVDDLDYVISTFNKLLFLSPAKLSS